MISVSASLPPELERHIFELTVLLHPVTGPKLILVAQRVYEWLLPFLYRQIDLIQETHVHTFLSAMASDRQSLLLGVHDMVFPNTPTTRQHRVALYTGLRFCRNLSGLALAAFASSEILDHQTLASINLRRFTASLYPYLRTGIDQGLLLSAFQHLTHLHCLMDTGDNTDALRRFIVQLPALTHLALTWFTEPGYAERLAGELPRLRVFILAVTAAEFRGISAESPVFDRATFPELRDQRIVVSVFRQWYEGSLSNASVTGEKNLWDLAEDFIEAKAAGSVPASELWARP
ncbi:hypothetical protein MIND_01403900 [Mycena indigotica]|uniref:Uncharacterized protein n=1 Tax=Mycena indigotica TaxID=2126181 RepID=A0A8H6S080_9AGAR|nr:uncharacterized protein MIND_01403900 [Mycena indigotica]KAF7288880.1 hypothetical protein MIND_01403900 [Mycena indigotica]